MLEHGVLVIAATEAVQLNDGLAVLEVDELVCALLAP
jgi:hypothetical protein